MGQENRSNWIDKEGNKEKSKSESKQNLSGQQLTFMLWYDTMFSSDF